MAKTSREQQIKDERKILAELQKNSKENINTIAKDCGFSKQKAGRIIKQLEKNQIIWGYTAIVDEAKEDLSHFIMLIKKTSKPLDKEIENRLDSIRIEDFASIPGATIESSCIVHGKYDWIISFTAQDIMQAKNFCNNFCNGFVGLIEKMDLIQALYFVRKHHIFNPNRKKLSDFM